jgi:predicted regulator of Ras-like GTPase activity (Roadblock/LC7/MglB family)
MSFNRILEKVVSETRGAVGAIFLDREGEEIAHYTILSGDEVKLIGAHYGIVWLEIDTMVSRHLAASAAEAMFVAEKGVCLMRPVQKEYMILLVVEPSEQIGQARGWLRWAAAEIQKEI